MSLLSLLFPDKCVFCGGVTDGDICVRCADTLPKTEGLRAVRHGEFFSLCVSPFYYLGPVRESVIRYKFHRKQSYARTYAKYCAPLISERLDDRFDVITWVPVSRRRKRERGFDQSELLAKAIGRELGAKCERLIVKNRDTPTQSTLTGEARRRANVSGAFSCTGSVTGRRILLVDDIITTGATMSECARVLLMAGAEDVVACTIAVAGK
jgi:ComF family protein